jgi:hypothetical protein
MSSRCEPYEGDCAACHADGACCANCAACEAENDEPENRLEAWEEA